MTPYLIILAVSAVVGVAVYFASGWWMERFARSVIDTYREDDVDAMLPPRGDR